MSALISWRNAADSATLTLIDGTADSNFPIANLKLRGLADVFRTASGTQVKIGIDNRSTYYGPVDASFYPSFNNTVHGLQVLEDGDILACGAFTSVSGTTPQRLARLKSNGVPDIAFNANLASGANGTVLAVLYDPSFSGQIIIGGSFTTVQGVTRTRIARLTPSGVLDSSGVWPASDTVRVIAQNPWNNQILVGGDFTTFNGVSVNRLCRYASSPSWGFGVNGAVRAIAFGALGEAFVGGNFTASGAASRTCIACFGVDGSLMPFAATIAGNYGAGITGIHAIAVQIDGKVIIGGNFSTVNGVSRFCLARLNADGSIDTGFGIPFNTTNGTVESIAVMDDGKILVGGVFTTLYGVAKNRIARLNPDGSFDDGFLAGANNAVYTMAKTSDGVFVGGLMTSVDGIGMGRLTRLLPVPPRRLRLLGLLGLDVFSGTISLSVQDRDAPIMRPVISTRIAGSGAKSLVIPLPASIEPDRRFELTWSSLDGQPFSLARLWIGEAIELGDGVDAQWRSGFRDSGTLDVTDGGQHIPTVGVVTRTLSLSLSAKDTELAWGFKDGGAVITNADNLHALQREAGTVGEVIVVPRASTPLWAQASGIYGHIDGAWEIEHQSGPNWRAAFTVEQER